MHPLKNIKNVIFDLGGVIIDLDFQETLSHFSTLSGLSTEEVKDRTQGLMLFKEYEKGLISSADFRDQVRKVLKFEANDARIDEAWNSLLGGMPKERLQLLQRLKLSYRTFALSNTNEIHVKQFSTIVSKSLGSIQSFIDLFERVYFSHEMKMRKPESEIYQTVLETENLPPHCTLFIDDNWENIQSAQALGIQTHHLRDANTLIQLFHGI